VSEEETFCALIRRVRAGDREAAAELVRQYEPEIRRFIRLQLNNTRLRRTFDSADIFQSVFLNFYVRVMGGQFDLEEPTQLLRLLTTMARNRITDHVRRPAARARDGGPALWDGVADSGASPSDAVTQEEILQEVLRRLTPEERDLVEKRGEGRSWQELADELGGTPEAVRKRLARALERICQELDPEGDGDA
jgi:RNA polymerase sigma-70 factor (ECF subfamily)